MKYIITGAWGFIGSEFLKKVYVENQFTEIIVVDKQTYAADQARVPIPILRDERVQFITEDICNLTYEMVGDFDYLVNFAAETHVDNSIIDGKPFIRSNYEGVFNLLEVARQSKTLKKFVQISTDEVYGDVKDEFCSRENDVLNPSSYYASTKAGADLLVKSAHRTYGLPYLITRSCNNFGGLQHQEKFIPKVIDCIKSDKPIPVYGNGDQKRVWISVEDNVNVIYQLVRSESCLNEIVNIGSEYQRTNIDIINAIGKVLQRTPIIEHIDDRLGHDVEYNLDLCKLQDLEFDHDFCIDEFKTPEEYFIENL
jgi:dTDP-glucose 4,6-dehydratase